MDKLMVTMVVPVVAVVHMVVGQIKVVLVTPEVIHLQKETMVVEIQLVLLIPQEEAEELVQ
ncbi:MAG: hypothetical protein CME98_22365 [Hyphomonas sp.]|nr:hypothetical protein [Hyphomonas sp.]